jgi:hypothetical protein
MGWFYFLLCIAITITNFNSSTSDVGGSLHPRLSYFNYSTYSYSILG